jgi:hypothetical protein
MDNRIEELAKKAGWDSHQIRYDTRIKQLAELIAKESTLVCNTIGKEARKEWKTTCNPHDGGVGSGAWQCGAAILEHFGVDE